MNKFLDAFGLCKRIFFKAERSDWRNRIMKDHRLLRIGDPFSVQGIFDPCTFFRLCLTWQIKDVNVRDLYIHMYEMNENEVKHETG